MSKAKRRRRNSPERKVGDKKKAGKKKREKPRFKQTKNTRENSERKGTCPMTDTLAIMTKKKKGRTRREERNIEKQKHTNRK
jgi:hypothetical protein